MDDHGCPKCSISYGESKILNFLEEHNIKYEYQKSFEKCKNKIKLRFDFYLNNENMCVEYKYGNQHCDFFKYFSGQKGYNEIRKRDKTKIKISSSVPKVRTWVYLEGIRIKIGLSSPKLTHQDGKPEGPRRMRKENVKINEFH